MMMINDDDDDDCDDDVALSNLIFLIFAVFNQAVCVTRFDQ